MNKLCRYTQNYLVYGFLPVVVLIIWSMVLGNDTTAKSNLAVRATHEILSYNLLIWFAIVILFMFSMVLIPEVRERTLRRLANLQERDEREEYITARAARTSYIATLSLTLLFLFFSLFTFHYSKLEKSSADQPGHSIAISIGYRMFAETQADKHTVKGVLPIIDSTSYALSSSTLLLMLLGWQLVIFKLSARKLSK